jgi:hypothetical protein
LISTSQFLTTGTSGLDFNISSTPSHFWIVINSKIIFLPDPIIEINEITKQKKK